MNSVAGAMVNQYDGIISNNFAEKHSTYCKKKISLSRKPGNTCLWTQWSHSFFDIFSQYIYVGVEIRVNKGWLF